MKKCPDCDQLFDDALSACPNCGCPAELCQSAPTQSEEPAPQSPVVQISNSNPSPVVMAQQPKRDWAHYVYECGVIAWHTFTKKYAKFDGRATRREFWSYWFIIGFTVTAPPFFTIIVLIPTIAACIRRLHDGNHSGWWCLVPFACFFLYLQRSDEGPNQYGEPDNDLGI